ncbi:MAG: sodium:proton antiporter NhaD [Myxococcota bacterium]
MAIFGIAYLLVVLEDVIKLRKSKPVILAAGAIWILTAIAYNGDSRVNARIAETTEATNAGERVWDGLTSHHLEERVMHHVGEYGALFLFLMVAMTYISAIGAHNVFLRINAWLVSSGFGLRAVFWTTGLLAFIISPIADNLTTALLMGAVVVTVGKGNVGFIAAACTNVVVAANAGGAFSPFGDITTLMVWQKGHVHTEEFVQILLPSIVAWLVPAICMHFFIPKEKPAPLTTTVELRPGWLTVILLFLATIATAVFFHAFLHLPPFLGMTTGLSYFMLYGFIRGFRHNRRKIGEPLDVFKSVREVEWDTMLFFFGVIMCVGGLQELMYLEVASEYLYGPAVGPFWANVSVGVASAVLDNVPVMFAVLGMNPQMDPAMPASALTHTPESLYQWLLVTLTAGVGGSMLSVGSAAGVALMGSAHGVYTFTRHLKWTPVIALGYGVAIWVHHLLNAP